MWARTLEFVLGVWLGISWIIFGYTPERNFLMVSDFICLFLITCFSLLSYLQLLRNLHLANVAISFYLIGFAYFVRPHFDPEAQNYMMVALLLLMLAIVPTHARRPPYQWIKFMLGKKR